MSSLFVCNYFFYYACDWVIWNLLLYSSPSILYRTMVQLPVITGFVYHCEIITVHVNNVVPKRFSTHNNVTCFFCLFLCQFNDDSCYRYVIIQKKPVPSSIKN
jgi:hypothetical protein